MKKIIPILTLFFYSASSAQTALTIVKFEKVHVPSRSHKINRITLSNGDYLYEGVTLKLGKGTLPNGDYNFIATASNTMQAKLRGNATLKELRIIEVNQKGNKEYGYKYFIKTEGGYLVQFEDAVLVGEIIYPNK